MNKRLFNNCIIYIATLICGSILYEFYKAGRLPLGGFISMTIVIFLVLEIVQISDD